MPKRIPAPREPRGIIRDYSRALRGLFEVSSTAIRRELLDAQEFAAATASIRARRGDDEVDDLEDAIGRISLVVDRELPDEVIRDIVDRYGLEADRHNLEEVRRTFRGAVGLDLPGSAPHGPEIIRAYARDNVRLIKTVHTGKLERVRALVERSWRVGDRWEVISSKIQAELGKDPTIADRIARDQIQKLNAELTRDRQVAAGVRRFAWRTSQDGRVRERHRRLEGKIFAWDAGHPTERFPGWPIHCRCYAEPVLEDEDGEFVGPLGNPFDATGFPDEIGYSATSGGPRDRPSRAGIPPRPGRGPAHAPRSPRRRQPVGSSPWPPGRTGPRPSAPVRPSQASRGGRSPPRRPGRPSSSSRSTWRSLRASLRTSSKTDRSRARSSASGSSSAGFAAASRGGDDGARARAPDPAQL